MCEKMRFYAKTEEMHCPYSQKTSTLVLAKRLSAFGFGNSFATAEAADDLSVVAEVDVSLQAMQEAVIVVVQILIVNNQGIELVPGFETADLAEDLSG